MQTHATLYPRAGPFSRLREYQTFNYLTSEDRYNAIGLKEGGADSNVAAPGQPHGKGCSGYSGWYTYRLNNSVAHRHWKITRGRVTRGGHCPRSARVDFESRSANAVPKIYEAYCDMRRGGWQLRQCRRRTKTTSIHGGSC